MNQHQIQFATINNFFNPQMLIPIYYQEYNMKGFEYGSQTSTSSDDHPLDYFQTNNVKIKTTLCKNFSRDNFCPYGQKCQFAHGVWQLKCNKQNKIFYKTRVCTSFSKKLFCPYGSRCNYLHTIPKQSTNWKIMYENCGEILRQERAQRKIKNSQGSRLLALLNKQTPKLIEKRSRKYSLQLNLKQKSPF